MERPGERTWLQHLTPAECWKLLSETPVGRLGVLVNSAPEIYPVNYVVDHDTIVFRTEAGTKLAGLERSPSVCVQIDGIDPDDRSGWSVLVKGRATEITDPVELRLLADLPLDFWSVGPKPNWVRVVPAEVTGRRVGHGTIS